MKTLLHLRRHDNKGFHMHPANVMFALLGSVLLALSILVLLSEFAK